MIVNIHDACPTMQALATVARKAYVAGCQRIAAALLREGHEKYGAVFAAAYWNAKRQLG